MIKKIDFSRVEITDGFWRERQKLNREQSIPAVLERFTEMGKIDAMSFRWDGNEERKPHFFWESDVAKWIEGVSYELCKERNSKLEALIDSIVDGIAENQCDDGYYNVYFTMFFPELRFSDRDKHELYCAGHLIEAAVAYYKATGKRKFLDCMAKYADYIEKRFKTDMDAAFATPGHEEIELALFKLYEATGERRYFELSEYFINTRGTSEKDADRGGRYPFPRYGQSHLPVRRQRTAEGHAVRATYLYSAMADLAAYTKDEELIAACKDLFSSITERRMYITGGIGSSAAGEAFTVDYDLPSLLAYTESCASIGLVLFAKRMLSLHTSSRYSDVIERVIYNGFLSSTSLDGRSFFYENPLEALPYLATKDVAAVRGRINYPPHSRAAMFKTSCCPPNIVRFVSSLGDLVFGEDESRVYIHQYMNARTSVERNGKKIEVNITTDFPCSGRVRVSVCGGALPLSIRIPWWHRGERFEATDGYHCFELSDGESRVFDFDMTPRFVEARPQVIFCAGKYAVMRGPVVYCSESVDNGSSIRDMRLDVKGKIKVCDSRAYGIPTLEVPAYRRAAADGSSLYTDELSELIPTTAKLIPYYAFANRGEAEMQVWHNVVIK